MDSGRRDKVPFPKEYRGFRLIRTHGRVFGIPAEADPQAILHTGQLFTHPAVISAATLEDIRRAIDGFDRDEVTPEPVGARGGYELVRLRVAVYAVPSGAGPADLLSAADRRRSGVISGNSVEAVERAIVAAKAAVPVEFAGWLPVYEVSGNCGAHPQFAHTGDPPGGFRFTNSAPPPERRPSWWARNVRPIFPRLREKRLKAWYALRAPFAFLRPGLGVGLWQRVAVFVAMLRLFVTLLRAGCGPLAAVKFLQSRHLQSQLLAARARGPVFLTSMPYTFGQNPWVIEIEDPTTLFYPLVQNGHTCGLSLRESPYFPAVKALLEADHCKAILTHIRSTAEMVPQLFQSEAIRSKVVYRPLGVRLPARWQRHDPRPDGEPIHLLFINSWCQVPENFYVRGGLDLLEAFGILRERYPQLRLTMRTALPHLADHYHRIIESGWVRVINRFLTSEEMADLHADSDIYLLPAARVHIVSLLQAMSYGLAVVASDGWGMEEYADDGRNALVVKGRYGVTSWADPDEGMLRENYEPMWTPDPKVVAGIVEAVSRLVEDRELRRRLGRAAREDVRARFNVANWNDGMGEALGRTAGRVVQYRVGVGDEIAASPAGRHEVEAHSY